MESLGENLKTAREQRGLDLDQASVDTKIALRYLCALESEDFSGFPGEAYITGFLRNYGTYLDLDVEELLGLYRALKIQEQPIPVEQLLKPPSPMPKIAIAALIVLVLAAVGGGIFFLITRPPKPRAEVPVPKPPVSPVEHIMNADSFEHRFYKGDSILVSADPESSSAEKFKLELLNLGEAVTIRTPDGTVILDLSQNEANVNLDNNGISSLRIVAEDYDKKKPDMGVHLRFELSDKSPLVVSAPAETTSTSAPSTSTIILSSSNPYPFTLQANFQGYCMFRWEILRERDRRDRNERYFQRSDELNIQAQNGIRLWTSNAQAVKFTVIGGGRTVPVEVGNAGEVVVADILWVRDEDNRYRLIVSRLETVAT